MKLIHTVGVERIVTELRGGQLVTTRDGKSIAKYKDAAAAQLGHDLAVKESADRQNKPRKPRV